MGWFSQAKKKLKKISLKNIGKKLADGVEDVAELASNLPAPVGTIANAVDKTLENVDKIQDKVKGLIPKKSKTSKKSMSQTSSSELSRAEKIAIIKAKIRKASAKAKADNYKKYV
jgi:hypothetical protein